MILKCPLKLFLDDPFSFRSRKGTQGDSNPWKVNCYEAARRIFLTIGITNGFPQELLKRDRHLLSWDIGTGSLDTHPPLCGVCCNHRKGLHSAPTRVVAWNSVSNSYVPPDRPCRELPHLDCKRRLLEAFMNISCIMEDKLRFSLSGSKWRK